MIELEETQQVVSKQPQRLEENSDEQAYDTGEKSGCQKTSDILTCSCCYDFEDNRFQVCSCCLTCNNRLCCKSRTKQDRAVAQSELGKLTEKLNLIKTTVYELETVKFNYWYYMYRMC